ncbi:helix-turn-helix domain-containing protein [Actinomycetospora sp. NBRC 106378]|uniref:helix-turn-helix domain-containing protein n=1 Tax=Actinomycetospora sp. NBRC 106378 TaxID=3032208 RepID=UPI002553C272|nr:helix-turn-helix domain-containing protein [Actinomycetospora sp. NBRC 106378]
MHDRAAVDAALALFDDGLAIRAIARRLGLPPTTVWHWCRGRRDESVSEDSRRERCARCHGTDLDRHEYAYLLGQYLGDGHISVGRRAVASLSVFCADDWPGIRDEVDRAMRAVMPTSSVSQVVRTGCREVKSYSTHWACLFPQHGPGRKHERPIVLAPWQEDVVREHTGRLLRGLIHSDGCRTLNWARPRPDGKRYVYPRYWFSNQSTDILDICSRALDRVGIEHRRPRWNAISVARRASVARLDEFVGPKY